MSEENKKMMRKERKKKEEKAKTWNETWEISYMVLATYSLSLIISFIQATLILLCCCFFMFLSLWMWMDWCGCWMSMVSFRCNSIAVKWITERMNALSLYTLMNMFSQLLSMQWSNHLSFHSSFNTTIFPSN